MNYLKLTTYHAGLLQARAYRNLTSLITKSLVQHDLALTEWALLGLLSESNGLQPSDLSTQLGVTKPLTSRHIKHLSDLGIVARIDHTDDARSAVVHLTEEGKNMVSALERELRGAMRKYLKGISLRQLASYLTVLEQLASRDI